MEINKIGVVRSDASNLSTKNEYKKYSQTPKMISGLSTDKIAFGAKRRTVEEEMKLEYESRDIFGKLAWSFGGKSKYRDKVENNLRDEIQKKERSAERSCARSEARDEKRWEDLARQKQVIQAKNEVIDAHISKEKAYKETIFHQNESLKNQNRLISATEDANANLKNLLKDQEALVEQHKTTIEELFRKSEEAKVQNNKKLEDALNLQMTEMQNAHKADLEEISKRIDKAGQSAEVFENMVSISKEKGFGKLAGYQEQKDILMDHFGTPIALEKNGMQADVPGGAMFFGPHATGKSTFAEAFAEQMGCILVDVPTVPDEKMNWKNLTKALKNVKKQYEKDKIRRIIRINEFDVFAPQGSRIAGSMKDLMDTLSEKYHCTLFTTTNYPLDVDKGVLRDGRFYKVGLPPADRKNAAAVLEHWANKYADKSVKYDEIAGNLVKSQPDNAFSNERIKSVVTAITGSKLFTGKLTQESLIASIKELGPDIGKLQLDAFRKELELVKHI